MRGQEAFQAEDGGNLNATERDALLDVAHARSFAVITPPTSRTMIGIGASHTFFWTRVPRLTNWAAPSRSTLSQRGQ